NVMHCAPESYSGNDDAETGGKSSTPRRLLIYFSSPPESLDVVRAREILRLTPPVDDLTVETDGQRLRLGGRFLAETTYELRIAPGALRDSRQRLLEGAPLVQRFAFAADKPSLQWDVRQGIVERFGPQLVPLRGHGYDKADVRIHAIDPLARDFWPFPSTGVDTTDGESPPLPGNEPGRWTQTSDVADKAIIARIKALGSPAGSWRPGLRVQRRGLAAECCRCL